MCDSWTHSICDKCWREEHGDRQPVQSGNDPEQSPCCFCGDPTTDGIYVRADTREVERARQARKNAEHAKTHEAFKDCPLCAQHAGHKPADLRASLRFVQSYIVDVCSRWGGPMGPTPGMVKLDEAIRLLESEAGMYKVWF